MDRLERQPQSVPVSLMVIVAGLAIVYAVLHGHGWRWNGNARMIDVWDHLTLPARILMIVGLILNAWGVGALIDGLTRRMRNN